MAEIIVRNVIGFLVQVVPAAALCLMPFNGRFRCGARRAWLMASLVVAIGLVPFLLVAASPLIVPGGVPFEVYNPLQNLVFLVTVSALFMLYLRVVDAETAHKVFVFSVVMLYGFLVTSTSSNVSHLLGFAEQSDGYMYYPPRLAVLALTNIVFFGAMGLVMHSVKRAFSASVSPQLWLRMALFLLGFVATLLVGTWLPPLDNEGMYFTLSFVVAIDSVALVWWMLRVIREVSEQAQRQATLEQALREHAHARKELENELSLARERMTQLERANEPTSEETPVVLSTPSQAVSFMPDDIMYVDSLNRVRAIHFGDGESIQMSMTLAQIADALPKDRFAYCHRSVVVNLRHVRALGASDLALDDGTVLPVSRRRMAELREALGKTQG